MKVSESAATMDERQYQAFMEYYDQYKTKVNTYLYYRVGQDQMLAEDLTSDTFLKAFKAWSSFDHKHQFSTWVFTIARNTLYDYYRRQRPTEEIDPEKFTEPTNFLEALDTAYDREIVEKAMENLPLKQKEILILRYTQNWSTEEVAQRFNTSEANIRKISSRAIERVRAWLPQWLLLII